jgi:hypothetical protein
MIIDSEDFNLDFLFYHRKLKRLVAHRIKIREIASQTHRSNGIISQMVRQIRKQEGENTSIGLILCAESSREQIELLEMYKEGIIIK